VTILKISGHEGGLTCRVHRSTDGDKEVLEDVAMKTQVVGTLEEN
jgi:hypothetical protein